MSQSKKILITGGTGFLGTYIVEELINKGYELTIIGSSDVQQDSDSPKVKFDTCDILDYAKLVSFVKKTDIVIHAAGYISYLPKHYDKLYNINVTGAENIANACIENPHVQLIHVSSTAAFPTNDVEPIVDESHRFNDRNFITEYAMTKYMGESHVWRASAEGINTCIINPGLILGVGDWNKGTPNFFKKIQDGLRYYPVGGNGIVYAKDVSKFIRLILEAKKHEEQYILVAETISYFDLFGKIAHALNMSPPSIPINGYRKLLARINDWMKHVFNGEDQHLSKQSIQNISKMKQFKNDRSLTLSLFEYTSIDNAIEEIASSYLN